MIRNKLIQLVHKNRTRTAAMLALLFFMAAFGNVLAQMSSGSYKIPSDSINVGGNSSGSSSYNMLDTVGEAGTGTSSSSSYTVNAGFIAMQETYLALSSPSDVTMNSISGLTGGTGTGSAAWTVTTDNAAGYSLSIRSTTSPALQSGGDSFANYAPVSSDPDYSWSIATSASEFGFSPEGSDIVSRFKDNGSACNTGSLDTSDKCWDGFSTSDVVMSQRTSANHPGGTTTTVKLQSEIGTSKIQTSGNYSAEIVVTVVAL